MKHFIWCFHLQNVMVKEVMETVTVTDDEQADTAESANKTADEEDLLNLFNQYPDVMSSISDWLFKDIDVIINEASSEGISAEYSITMQQYTSTVLFETHVNVSVMSQKFFNTLPQKPKLLKPNACTVTLASGTDLGPIGQCNLTFRLWNKCFTDKFIIFWDLHWDLITGLNWQINYKIGWNLNITRHQYMTNNND